MCSFEVDTIMSCMHVGSCVLQKFNKSFSYIYPSQLLTKPSSDLAMNIGGHDAHTAMLLGAAMILKNHEAEIVAAGGAVRLFFQPAEEGGAGAKAMIDEGANIFHLSFFYNIYPIHLLNAIH